MKLRKQEFDMSAILDRLYSIMKQEIVLLKKMWTFEMCSVVHSSELRTEVFYSH